MSQDFKLFHQFSSFVTPNLANNEPTSRKFLPLLSKCRGNGIRRGLECFSHLRPSYRISLKLELATFLKPIHGLFAAFNRAKTANVLVLTLWSGYVACYITTPMVYASVCQCMPVYATVCVLVYAAWASLDWNIRAAISFLCPSAHGGRWGRYI